MALKDHTIDSSKISEEQIETIISGHVKYDPSRKTVVLLPDTQKFSNEKRILLYLTALQGWKFVMSKEAPTVEASPQEVSQRTGIPGGSVRPILGALVDRGILGKQKGKYFMPPHNLGVVQDAITSSDRGGFITSGSAVNNKRKNGKKTSPKGKTGKNNVKTKPSLASGFSSLVEGDWFTRGKTLNELKDKLDEMTIFPPQGQLPHYLLRAYRAEQLDRKKENRGGKTVWVYYKK